MNIALAVHPCASGKSDFDVMLSDSAARPTDDAARVMLVTGKSNMIHEASSFDAVSAGRGHYRAGGSWL